MPKLNWEIVLWNITEAREQLEQIEQSIKSGEISEGSFRVLLEHAFHHVNFACNIRKVTSKRYANMSDEDFNLWSKFPIEIEPYEVRTSRK